jgi:hypothetical protein
MGLTIREVYNEGAMLVVYYDGVLCFLTPKNLDAYRSEILALTIRETLSATSLESNH